ncbi:MAG: RDD family protein [Methanobacteriota archaeon]
MTEPETGTRPSWLLPLPSTAGLLPRGVAVVTDVALTALVFSAAAGALAARFDEGGGGPSSASPTFLALLYVPFVLLYFTLFEGTIGRTPGKALVGLRVIGLAGDRPSLFDAFVRNLLRLLWGIPAIGLAFLAYDARLVATDELERRLGDLAAHTIVVETRGTGGV